MEEIHNIVDSNVYVSGEPWFDFLLRLIVNIISLFILIRFIYYPNNYRIKYIFTFFLMGMMIFLIASILDQVDLKMGLALGLFAIFGIIRFRSPSVDLKEMTYLFLAIGMSVINALVQFNVANWLGLLVADFMILISAFALEAYKPKGYIIKRALIFTPSNFSVLNNNELLLNEITENTGIQVTRVDITKINKTKNEVTVWIYFDERNQKFIQKDKVETSELSEENSEWIKNSTIDY